MLRCDREERSEEEVSMTVEDKATMVIGSDEMALASTLCAPWDAVSVANGRSLFLGMVV